MSLSLDLVMYAAFGFVLMAVTTLVAERSVRRARFMAAAHRVLYWGTVLKDQSVPQEVLHDYYRYKGELLSLDKSASNGRVQAVRELTSTDVGSSAEAIEELARMVGDMARLLPVPQPGPTLPILDASEIAVEIVQRVTPHLMARSWTVAERNMKLAEWLSAHPIPLRQVTELMIATCLLLRSQNRLAGR